MDTKNHLQFCTVTLLCDEICNNLTMKPRENKSLSQNRKKPRILCVIKNTNFMCIFPLPIKAWLFKWPYFTEKAPVNSLCLQCKYWTRISNEKKAVLELIWKEHDVFISLAIRYQNLCMLLLVSFLSVIPIFLHWKLYNSNNSLKLHWCGFIFCSNLFIIALVYTGPYPAHILYILAY